MKLKADFKATTLLAKDFLKYRGKIARLLSKTKKVKKLQKQLPLKFFEELKMYLLNICCAFS